jgi:2-dehydropantoate 2-reductase
MRFIVYGVGAIGGTIAASLVLSGHEVAGIARGAQLEAIRGDGLLFRTPLITERVHFPCFGAPGDVGFRDDDVIMLTMKSQDTHDALIALRDAGMRNQAIVCAQNGIDNERQALRLFPNVYGMTVMCPGTYTQPGEVLCHAKPKRGIFDLGRYPHGLDDTARAIATAMEASELRVFLFEDVMRSKHGKLLENQGNTVRAALGPEVSTAEFDALLRAEGEAVYRAARIEWLDIGSKEQRRVGVLEMGEIAGATRAGDSSSQSLTRGTGSIETDFLNGEIVLLGRLLGVPVPVNAFFCDLGARLVREGMKPGTLSVEDLRAGLRAAGVTL